MLTNADKELVLFLGQASPRAPSKVIPSHSMSHRPLFDVPDPLPSFCSTPPPSTPNSLLMTRIKRPPCATPPGRLLFGLLAASSPLEGYEPRTLHRRQQRAHADQLLLEEKQLQHGEQRPCHHSRSLREL